MVSDNFRTSVLLDMLLSVATMKLLLLLMVIIFFKDITADKVIKICDGNIFTSNETHSASSQDVLQCCISESCPCYSFDDLLVNFTRDVTICVTSDMVLSSVIQLTHVKNIAIIGYNNPTVQCSHSGGLHFVSCHNFTIEGINWNGCGAGLYMYNTSNISYQNCTFQNSLGPSLVLSEVSGNVNINNCKFTHNNYYNNYGTAIHYSSNDNAQLVFMINNCTFDYNEGASIVYFYQSGTSQKYLSLENSTFNNNQGVSVYIINQQLFINGLVLFEENNATDGGGLIAYDHVTVIFTESSVVTFNRNVANRNGGAIFIAYKSVISFEQTSVAIFYSNTAVNGGAIFLIDDSVISIKGYSNITFTSNSATNIGGAVVSYNKCNLLLVENSTVSFTDNTAEVGGALYLQGGSKTIFDNNTVIAFTNNSAIYQGGAIHSQANTDIVSNGNSSVVFNNNYAKQLGGI